jgi:iron complex transport system ATP-binding protein
MRDSPLIEIRNATIYRGDTRVFHNFSLSIEQHEQVAILGPNGSGKTTLLKTLNRELYPVINAQSTLKILGQDRWNVWSLRKHIGIVSHELQMNYTRGATGFAVVLSGFLSSVGVHGSLSAKVSARHRARARAVLRDLGIADLAERKLSEMSTGQQRRCLLARALVHDPDTLILDEPTAGLDLTASFDLLARMRGLINAGKSLLLVTHQLNDIPPDIHRIILLRSGQIVADGEKASVLTEANLRQTYGTPMRISETDGYFFATPRANT